MKVTLERIRAVMPVFQGEQDGRKRDPPSRRLWTALREIDRYLTSQSAWLVNYAGRHRAGLRVGTALTEGTANFLVNRRMNKSQHMRWSRRGADLLLQVRCAIVNGKFRAGLGRLFQSSRQSRLRSGYRRPTPIGLPGSSPLQIGSRRQPRPDSPRRTSSRAVLPQLRFSICSGALLIGLHLLAEYGLYVTVRFEYLHHRDHGSVPVRL